MCGTPVGASSEINSLNFSYLSGIHMTAADPDFPDRRIASELAGRVIQLEHIWSQVHDPMPEAEAEKLLREVFTDKASQDFLTGILQK